MLSLFFIIFVLFFVFAGQSGCSQERRVPVLMKRIAVLICSHLCMQHCQRFNILVKTTHQSWLSGVM